MPAVKIKQVITLWFKAQGLERMLQGEVWLYNKTSIPEHSFWSGWVQHSLGAGFHLGRGHIGTMQKFKICLHQLCDASLSPDGTVNFILHVEGLWVSTCLLLSSRRLRNQEWISCRGRALGTAAVVWERKGLTKSIHQAVSTEPFLFNLKKKLFLTTWQIGS